MKKILFALTLLLSGGPVLGGPIDGEIDALLSDYFKIQTALADDSTAGVDSAARSIHLKAGEIESADPAVQKLLQSLKEAAKKIQGKDLERTRLQFFELSKPLLAYLHQFHSSKESYSRYYCSMAKKGWVQAERGTKNPYYGSSMLACGDLIQ